MSPNFIDAFKTTLCPIAVRVSPMRYQVPVSVTVAVGDTPGGIEYFGSGTMPKSVKVESARKSR